MPFHFLCVICKAEGFNFHRVRFIHFNFIVSAFCVLRNLYPPRGHENVLLHSLSRSVDLGYSLSQSLTGLITVLIQYALISGKVILPRLRFSFKIVLTILGPLLFLINFKISLSLSPKNLMLDFDKNCAQSVDEFGENWHLYSVECSRPEHSICLHLGILFFPSLAFNNFQHIDRSNQNNDKVWVWNCQREHKKLSCRVKSRFIVARQIRNSEKALGKCGEYKKKKKQGEENWNTCSIGGRTMFRMPEGWEKNKGKGKTH